MIERMAVAFSEVKFAPADADEMTFTGYGAVFGNVDSYGDVIQRGAFAKSIHDARTSGAYGPISKRTTSGCAYPASWRRRCGGRKCTH